MQQTNLTIRLSKKEKATLQKLAHIEGKNMTDFIKSKVFNVEEKHIQEVQEGIRNISQSSKNNIEKHLELISKIVLTNNSIIKRTLVDSLTEEQRQDIRNEVNNSLSKVFENK